MRRQSSRRTLLESGCQMVIVPFQRTFALTSILTFNTFADDVGHSRMLPAALW